MFPNSYWSNSYWPDDYWEDGEDTVVVDQPHTFSAAVLFLLMTDAEIENLARRRKRKKREEEKLFEAFQLYLDSADR